MSILADVRQHIEDAGLVPEGHEWRLGRMSGVDSTSNKSFIMLRQMGEGASNVLLQRIDVLVMIAGADETAIAATDTLADALVRLFREDGTQPDVVRFEVVGGKNGPFFLESNKPFYEINVRCYVEDY